jgi:bacteriorhodopsin
MGGIYQLMELLAVAIAILAILLLLVFLVGRLFQKQRTRRRILWGALTIYALAFVAYFGFIGFVLSGNLN